MIIIAKNAYLVLADLLEEIFALPVVGQPWPVRGTLLILSPAAGMAAGQTDPPSHITAQQPASQHNKPNKNTCVHSSHCADKHFKIQMKHGGREHFNRIFVLDGDNAM